MPDTAQTEGAAYLRPRNLALVFMGGTLGVLARELLMWVIPDMAGLPLAVLVANLVGAFLLGALLEALTRSKMAKTGALSLRLLLGTGLLGGFTTYSALAAAVAVLWADGFVGVAVAYGAATILFGAFATLLGVLFGSWLGGARRRSR